MGLFPVAEEKKNTLPVRERNYPGFQSILIGVTTPLGLIVRGDFDTTGLLHCSDSTRSWQPSSEKKNTKDFFFFEEYIYTIFNYGAEI